MRIKAEPTRLVCYVICQNCGDFGVLRRVYCHVRPILVSHVMDRDVGQWYDIALLFRRCLSDSVY